MHKPSLETTTTLKARLSRIEGQARGIRKMLDDERECREVLQQLSALHAAVQSANQLFMRAYARDCLLEPDNGAGDEATAERETLVNELLDMMEKVK